MRMPIDLFRLAVCFYILSSSSQPIFAIEPWADKRLTITNGLELWLDASKEIAARSQTEPRRARTQSTSKLIYDGPLDLWHDASGNGHHVRQLVSAARPRFVRTTAGATVRFDGVDDFMAVTGLDKETSEATIFILGAPRSNRNIFGAFLALNREGANDFQTGLNVDMANGSKTKFDFLNVEGAGFVGVQNLMTSSVPFGETHVISIIAEAGTNDTRVWIDGVGQDKFGRQPRAAKKSREPSERLQKNGEAAFGFDQVTVGARFFSNVAEPAHVQGFFDGDLQEVLIYNRI